MAVPWAPQLHFLAVSAVVRGSGGPIRNLLPGPAGMQRNLGIWRPRVDLLPEMLDAPELKKHGPVEVHPPDMKSLLFPKRNMIYKWRGSRFYFDPPNTI